MICPPSGLKDIFTDEELVKKIQDRLPYLFQLAELEASRAGNVGMEVGSLREQIIVALLIYKFGEENVDTNIPITEHDVDVRLCGIPISIKTISGKRIKGVKVSWTVDAVKVQEFINSYSPKSEMLLIHINWGGYGRFYYIPLSAQLDVFGRIGQNRYLKPPKQGTNPRGVEISEEAISELTRHHETKYIDIFWRIDQKIRYDPYKRWVEYWRV